MATVTKENLKKDKEKQNRGLIKHQTKFKKGAQQIKGIRQELEPMKPLNKLIKGENQI
jgi:hypothetical protein